MKVSWLWVFVAGLLSVAAQIIVFYARFGRWNTDSVFTDYLLFFLSGALGGWILIFFLNRQPSSANRRAVWIAFLVASPIALLMMLAGGMLGPLGVLIFPQIPWAIFTWVGSWMGKLVARGSVG
ncbi:MAG TPA: hypothetical protein VJ785_10330 [Anaerolineales bacterium]|nr:hypothetical protein [Anaerolineales bacterium]